MFVIVGVPGSGKTTLASLLAKRGFKVIELKEFVEENDLYLAYEVERDTLIVPYDICIEGAIVVSTFVPECDGVRCILVEAPPDVIRERLRRRGYDERKIEENVEAIEILRMEVEEMCSSYIIVDGRNVRKELERVIEFIKNFEDARERRNKMRAIVLAGGFGTRLRPLTYVIPKPALPIANRPMIQRILDRLEKNDIKGGVVSTGYKAELVKEAIEGYRAREVVREDSPLDTGGGLKYAYSFLGDDVFVAMNGDIITEAPLREMIKFHEEQEADLTILAYTVDDPRQYGVLLVDGYRILGFVEKPERPPSNLINAGVYIMNKKVVEYIPEGKVSLEKEVFPRVVKELKVVYFKYSGPRFDAGKPHTFLAANKYLVHKHPELAIADGAIIEGSVIDSAIGRNVVVSEGARIENSVILNDSVIGRSTKICNALIGRKARIGPGLSLKRLVLADHSIVERFLLVSYASSPGDRLGRFR